MDYLGYLAGILSVITFIPQIIKLYKVKSAKDISVLMIIIFCLSISLWLSYGIYLINIPMILANGIMLFLGIIILILILKYK